MHSFYSKLCCSHLIDLRAYALVSNYLLSPGIWQCFTFGAVAPQTQSAASPYFYFLPGDILNFGDLMTTCEVMESNRETIFSLPQKNSTSLGLLIFFFFLYSLFLDSATVSGKGLGDLILSLSSYISVKRHKARTLFLSNSCQILSMDRFYFPLLSWPWRFYVFVFFF